MIKTKFFRKIFFINNIKDNVFIKNLLDFINKIHFKFILQKPCVYTNFKCKVLV